MPNQWGAGAPAGGDATDHGPPWREHIFQRLKYLTLYGYYTSEEGLGEELHFRIIPGEFKGCVPYEEIHGHPHRGGEPAGPPDAGATQSIGREPSRTRGHDHG